MRPFGDSATCLPGVSYLLISGLPWSCRAVIATIGRGGLSRVTQGSNPLLSLRVYVPPSKGLMSYSWLADSSVYSVWGEYHDHRAFWVGGASGKEPSCQSRRLRGTGLIPGSGRSPEEGLGNPLQYSCLENPMNRGA